MLRPECASIPGGCLLSSVRHFGGYTRSVVVTESSDHLEDALVWELGGSLTEAKLSACLVQPLPVPHAKHLRFGVAQLCHRLCSGIT